MDLSNTVFQHTKNSGNLNNPSNSNFARDTSFLTDWDRKALLSELLISFVVIFSFFPSSFVIVEEPRGRILGETWSMRPYARADYYLTLSHSRISSPVSEFIDPWLYPPVRDLWIRLQLSTPTTMNADECFSNYSKMKQTIWKRESIRKGEGKGGICMSGHVGNPMPELTLTPFHKLALITVRGLRIWTQLISAKQELCTCMYLCWW